MAPRIRIDGLWKRYRLGGAVARYRTLRETLREACVGPARRLGRVLRGEAAAAGGGDFWALRDVSFEVGSGEVVGIVGRNGAGKSTLLKILSRITEPTRGEVRMRGAVGALLEVGSGFHPELSGRENVYLNGAILGMRRGEIERKFDEIVAFAELEQFLDTPVKHYSSGMYMRLAFAVAAHLEPAILVVDEVLAVGDAAFQKKCLGRMSTIASHGRTVLFVSHNMSAVQGLCSRAVWLDAGRVRADGSPGKVVAAYLGDTAAGGDQPITSGGHGLTVTRLLLKDGAGKITNTIPVGGDLTIEIHYHAERVIPKPQFWVALRCPLGTFASASMMLDGLGPDEILPGPGVVALRYRGLALSPQTYSIGIGARLADGLTPLLRSTDAGLFYVCGTAAEVGFTGEFAERDLPENTPILLPYEWQLPDGRICRYEPPLAVPTAV